VKASQTVGPESTVGNYPSQTPSVSPTFHISNNTGKIIGGAVGGIAGLGIIAFGFILCYRKRREALTRQREAQDEEKRAEPVLPSASQDQNAPPSTGYTSSNLSGPQSPPDGFYSDGSPWSPPPGSSTPPITTSPLSTQSLLLYHNHGRQNSASGPVDMQGSMGSTTSMGCVRCRQADYGHVLILLYRPTSPTAQYPGPHTSVFTPFVPTRPPLSGVQEAEM
jgi:hypothetical protein